MIVSGLTAELSRGKNVLITGDSGAGKSALFRILRGLWDINSGSLDFHWSLSPEEVLFLPQKPYFPAGDSLRQQMMYPKKVKSLWKGYKIEIDPSMQGNSEKFLEILEFVHLSYLMERCGGLDEFVEWDWIETLSPGELQRLSLARALYHKPKLLFLDEATSAIGFDMEAKLYSLLLKEGITCVSVGHRVSLKSFHDFELHLDGLGGWSLTEITVSSRSESLATNGSALGL